MMKTTEQRFYEKVKKLDSGCWDWIGSKSGNGRNVGVLYFNGSNVNARRVSWYIKTGDVPGNDKCITNTCKNQWCVNPDHLRIIEKYGIGAKGGKLTDRKTVGIWRGGNQHVKSDWASRFWLYVEKGVYCWEWQGKSIAGSGYPTFSLAGKLTYAHRASWILHHGDIPEGLFVCHKCDNKKCVNPAHLFLGTAKDNTRDMISKGRSHYGKWGWDKVMQIRELYDSGKEKKYKTLSDMFSIPVSTIRKICRRQTWVMK